MSSKYYVKTYNVYFDNNYDMIAKYTYNIFNVNIGAFIFGSDIKTKYTSYVLKVLFEDIQCVL